MLDEDHTTLSRKVAQMIDDTPTAMVAYDIQSMDEGERLMREGKIIAIVQIPAFFEKNILSNSQTHLENYISGTNISVNGLLSKDIQTAVTTFTAGVQLQVLMKQGLTQRQAMTQLMPVRFDRHVLFNPHINYGYYLSPSFMPNDADDLRGDGDHLLHRHRTQTRDRPRMDGRGQRLRLGALLARCCPSRPSCS